MNEAGASLRGGGLVGAPKPDEGGAPKAAEGLPSWGGLPNVGGSLRESPDRGNVAVAAPPPNAGTGAARVTANPFAAGTPNLLVAAIPNLATNPLGFWWTFGEKKVVVAGSVGAALPGEPGVDVELVGSFSSGAGASSKGAGVPACGSVLPAADGGANAKPVGGAGVGPGGMGHSTGAGKGYSSKGAGVPACGSALLAADGGANATPVGGAGVVPGGMGCSTGAGEWYSSARAPAFVAEEIGLCCGLASVCPAAAAVLSSGRGTYNVAGGLNSALAPRTGPLGASKSKCCAASSAAGCRSESGPLPSSESAPCSSTAAANSRLPSTGRRSKTGAGGEDAGANGEGGEGVAAFGACGCAPGLAGDAPGDAACRW